MKKHDIMKRVWIMTILAISTSVFAAGEPAPVSLIREGKKLIKLLASDKLDKKLVKYVVLHDATPKGLAEFAGQGKEQAALINGCWLTTS